MIIGHDEDYIEYSLQLSIRTRIMGYCRTLATHNFSEFHYLMDFSEL